MPNKHKRSPYLLRKAARLARENKGALVAAGAAVGLGEYKEQGDVKEPFDEHKAYCGPGRCVIYGTQAANKICYYHDIDYDSLPPNPMLYPNEADDLYIGRARATPELGWVGRAGQYFFQGKKVLLRSMRHRSLSKQLRLGLVKEYETGNWIPRGSAYSRRLYGMYKRRYRRYRKRRYSGTSYGKNFNTQAIWK